MSRWTEKFTYLSGTFIENGRYAFLLGRDDLLAKRIPHSVVAVLDSGEWKAQSYPFMSVAVCAPSANELVLIGHEGQIFSGEVHQKLEEEFVVDVDSPEGKTGNLRCGRVIAGHVYAAGMDRQVYRRESKGKWREIHESLPTEESDVVGFESIDGYSDDEIYAVGHEGEIWYYDGKIWHATGKLTKHILLSVHCAADGYVYVSGQTGLVIRGRKKDWQIISTDNKKNYDFWAVANFQGRTYAASTDLMCTLQDGVAKPVDFGDTDIPFSFYRLEFAGEQLLSVGYKDVMLFDGVKWKRLD